jgi:hypothetical protein
VISRWCGKRSGRAHFRGKLQFQYRTVAALLQTGEMIRAINAHVYEVRPRKDKRGVDLISDALPLGRPWYTESNDAVDYATFRSRSHAAVIRVYDDAGNVIETHEHTGDFKGW